MPQYVFKNKKTEELREVTMKISELDQYKEDNPDWVNQIQVSAITRQTGDMRPDKGFREVLSKIKKSTPRSNVNDFE